MRLLGAEWEGGEEMGSNCLLGIAFPWVGVENVLELEVVGEQH